ncbi:hypothetical protein DFH06DRAFT_1350723 [Mycena polygramma]|nr:hypothetical protein DFH06DRAFT_1350723 [Mycena polygramma]
MPRLSRAGCPLSLPTTFDFTAHMRRPLDVDPPEDFDLSDINAHNITRETSNKASLALTRAYVAASGTADGVGDADVGAPLQPFFRYSVEDYDLLVGSEAIEKLTGPLPLFQSVAVERERVKRRSSDVSRTQADRPDRESSAVSAALGTLVMVDPRPVSSTISGAPATPPLWLTSLQHQPI